MCILGVKSSLCFNRALLYINITIFQCFTMVMTAALWYLPGTWTHIYKLDWDEATSSLRCSQWRGLRQYKILDKSIYYYKIYYKIVSLSYFNRIALIGNTVKQIMIQICFRSVVFIFTRGEHWSWWFKSKYFWPVWNDLANSCSIFAHGKQDPHLVMRKQRESKAK